MPMPSSFTSTQTFPPDEYPFVVAPNALYLMRSYSPAHFINLIYHMVPYVKPISTMAVNMIVGFGRIQVKH